jgi:hypothetical protein
MGGAAGHLQHLYENLGLTFGDIKEVMASAAEGRLEGVSEKLDGMNLVFTWVDGDLKVARSPNDIRKGGMDAAALAKKFFGRGNVEVAFNDAFEVLRQALGALPDKQQRSIFKGGHRWYSMEVIYAPDPNVIAYDSNSIVFHAWPIYQTVGCDFMQVDDGRGLELLLKQLERMQQAVTVKGWRVRGPASLKLNKLPFPLLKRVFRQLDVIMAEAGVSNEDNVYRYLHNLLAPKVAALNLPQALYKMTLDRCVSGNTPPLTTIKRYTPKEVYEVIQNFVHKSDEVLKPMFLAPIEGTIHFFAIEVLRGLPSTLIAKSDEEVARLQSYLARAIKTIQASKHEAAMALLQKEMSRLGSVDNFAAAMEGIVFFYKGEAYKFTGAFAPAHQIMALFKYGRKGIPKMDLT